ncbi:MAG: M1 family aminopeptidase [Myxococcota bacterium]
MKRWLSLLLALLAPQGAWAATELQRHFDALWLEAASRAPTTTVHPLGIPRTPSGDYDLHRVDVDMTIHPDDGTLDATTTLTLAAQATTLTRLTMYQVGLQLLSVSDEQGALTWQLDPNTAELVIALRTALAPQQSVTLTLVYTGTPWCNGDCNIGEITYLPLYHLMPYDPDLFTGAWDDRYLAGYRVVVPATHGVLASGELVSQELRDDGTAAHTFEQAHPGLFFGITAAPYNITGGSMPVALRVAALPGHDVQAPVFMQILGDALQTYSTHYGALRFSHVGMAEIPYSSVAQAYGLEALIWYAEPHLVDAAAPFGSLTLAHEAGHQWWANMVAVAEAEAPWLSEGFAEFSAMLYTEETLEPVTYTSDEKRALRALHGDYYVYRDLFGVQDVPLTSADIRLADSTTSFIVTYMKGAMVVEALRDLLGDQTFNTTMQRYVSLHGEDGVTTSILQAVAEAESGLPLDDFFAAWVFGTGSPRYTVRTLLADAGAYVTLSLDDPTFVNQPVLVRAAGPGVACADVLVTVPSSGTQVELLCTGAPARVDVDPEYRFPRRVRSEQPGDLDGSGDVDGFDFVAAVHARDASFHLNSSHWNPEADLDEDGQITQADLDVIEATFGQSLTP